MLLSFTHAPFFHLGGWTIVDESGAETSVVIDRMTRGTRQDARMFDIPWTRANFAG
jgi:hypothetical protein